MSVLSQGRTPVKRRRLYEDVIEQLEAAITSHKLKPGDRLPSERELMKHFSVGRPSIREALFALRRMGLIAMKTGERALVVTPTPASLVNELSGVARHLLAAPGGMRSFQQARMLFESALAEHAARHATKDDIEALEAALRASEQSVDEWEEFQRADLQFHFLISQVAHNPIIAALHAGLVEWLTEQRAISVHTPDSKSVTISEHIAIFSAIARHDPQGAGDAMRAHLDRVSRSYWAAKTRIS